MLDTALNQYASLGATWDIRRAQAHFRGLGIRRGARGPRRRPIRGWDSLTDTERTVAAMVGQGMSNPQVAEKLFLSRRTVASHVSHILAKLEVHSRFECATNVERGGR